uniref:UspA domain-containing protein n=1 Tax=Setaria italica TaxID=4555 RepID=K3ZWF6_SETIT
MDRRTSLLGRGRMVVAIATADRPSLSGRPPAAESQKKPKPRGEPSKTTGKTTSKPGSRRGGGTRAWPGQVCKWQSLAAPAVSAPSQSQCPVQPISFRLDRSIALFGSFAYMAEAKTAQPAHPAPPPPPAAAVDGSVEHQKQQQQQRKTVVVVGVDDSEHSYYALEWTVRHVAGGVAGGAELVIVHAKPSASSVVSFGGPGAGEAMRCVEADLRKMAEAVVGRARQVCIANSVIQSDCSNGLGSAAR